MSLRICLVFQSSNSIKVHKLFIYYKQCHEVMFYLWFDKSKLFLSMLLEIYDVTVNNLKGDFDKFCNTENLTLMIIC